VDLRTAAGSSEIRFRQVETFSDHKGNISPEKKNRISMLLRSADHTRFGHTTLIIAKKSKKTRHFKTKFCIR